MKLYELEIEHKAKREELAAWLHEFADTLASNNQITFQRDGKQLTVKVPDEVEVEVELELKGEGTEVEISLSW